MPQAQPELKKVSGLSTLYAPFCPEISADVVCFLQYMEKRVFCQLNGNRKVIGILRGYDVCLHPLPRLLLCRTSPLGVNNGRMTVPNERGITNDAFAQVFMNIVLDEAFEEKEGGEKVSIGMIVGSMAMEECQEQR
jgi:small nuclear ribonucleoprotein G